MSITGQASDPVWRKHSHVIRRLQALIMRPPQVMILNHEPHEVVPSFPMVIV